jgi:hypothetical protein
MRNNAARPLAFVLALGLVSCGGNAAFTPGGYSVSATLQQPLSSGKIRHVVIVVQENRSFNDLFMGFPGAKTATYGYDSYGDRIKIKPIGSAIAQRRSLRPVTEPAAYLAPIAKWTASILRRSAAV